MYIRCRLTPCGIYIFINTDMSVYIYVGNVYISMCKQPIEYRFASIMRSIFRLMIDNVKAFTFGIKKKIKNLFTIKWTLKKVTTGCF